MATRLSESSSPKTHRASMNEVAARAGVSHQTVSRVINNSPNVSRATRERVEKVIRELNYRPSNSARALVTRHTKTIGFIAGGVSYYGPISTMGAIEAVAREHGFYLSVAILDENEYTSQSFEEVADSFLDQGVEAFIILAPTSQMVEAAVGANINQPRIILTSTHSDRGSEVVAPEESSAESKNAASVRLIGIDQEAAARSVIDYLAGLGHKDCTFFSGPKDWGDATMRLKAWEKCSAEYGWSSQTVQMESWDATEAYAKALALFAAMPCEELPTAIVTSNDLQAFGINKALHSLGVKVPEEISIVGFDDMPGADFHIPSLTTVRPDFDALGRAAMRELLEMLGIGKTTDNVRKNVEGDEEGFANTIPAQLVIRESSSAPRA